MSLRRHRLALALLAAALAGCCPKQASSVDAQPGGWIPLLDVPAQPGARVARETKPGAPDAVAPGPVEPSPVGAVPTAVPPSPSPVAVVPDSPLVPVAADPPPAPPPSPVAVDPVPDPSPRRPAGNGSIPLPGLTDAGKPVAAADGFDGPSLGRLGGLSEGFGPSTPSVGEAARRPSRSDSPSLFGIGSGVAGNRPDASPRLGAGSESGDLARVPSVFSLGQEGGRPRDPEPSVAPSALPNRPASPATGALAAGLPSREPGRVDIEPPVRPSLGLFGTSSTPTRRTPPSSVSPGPPPMSPPTSPASPSLGAPGTSVAPDLAGTRPSLGSASLASPSPGAKAPAIALPTPPLPGVSGNGSAATLAPPRAGGNVAPVPGTSPTVVSPPLGIPGQGATPDSAPSLMPPAARPESSSPGSPTPPPLAGAAPRETGIPGQSPGVPPTPPAVAGEDARAERRLAELREEYAAYEREAARLRRLLRRVLGLEPPEPEPEDAPPVSAEGG
jgi:hypothetical protein